MGMLVDGQWHVQDVNPKTRGGHFQRADQTLRDWIVADPKAPFAAEAHRYHLYISHACPWAHRTAIFRQLMQLGPIIGLSVVSPLMHDQGWTFNGDFPGVVTDTVNQSEYLRELYIKTDPHFTGRVTVPVLWDTQTERIVNSESADIIRMFNSAFNALTGNTLDMYPENLRNEIDEINTWVYGAINNGVYKAGFATTQTAYEKNCAALFEALDRVEAMLGTHRYLVGDTLTEADWRLFTTLIRFDPVYVGHFKCNKRRIVDYPHMQRYLRELYNYGRVRETVHFDHIKTHYYASHRTINPTGIVPLGPELGSLAP
jgi:glutathionyl-hydroquinone reductase